MQILVKIQNVQKMCQLFLGYSKKHSDFLPTVFVAWSPIFNGPLELKEEQKNVFAKANIFVSTSGVNHQFAGGERFIALKIYRIAVLAKSTKAHSCNRHGC